MNARAAQDRTEGGERVEIGLAGEAVVCDLSGALYLPADRMLVVSDLHLEKGSSFARRGMMLPPYDTLATLRMLGEVIARYDPATVVSLGDGFHDDEAAARMPPAWRDMLVAMTVGRRWIWIAGNHDPSHPADLPGEALSELALGALSLRHEPLRGCATGEVAGHLHPGGRIVRRGRSVRRACFITDGERLILPAFGAYAGALNVLDRAFHGLFRPERLLALMLGDARLYPIAGSALFPG
jgi:uncharacterized protein